MIKKFQIKKWNEYFQSLTKAEKRVAIAQDVLNQIKAKKYSPASGIYFQFSDTDDIEYTDSVQANFDKANCRCCALGSCMLSLVKYTNKFTFNNMTSANNVIWKELAKYFSAKQIALIEFSYEGWFEEKNDGVAKRVLHANIANSYLEPAINFHSKYASNKMRLVAIMKNIVENKGQFKPGKSIKK